MLLTLPHWAVKFAFKGSGKSSFGPLCPGQCSARMYVCVSGNLIDGKIVTGTSINPALTAFDSLPWLSKGYKLNIFIPNSSISFRDLCSLSGYLESLLHVPQQQCLVLTILSEIRRLKPFFWNENFAYIPSISPRTRWCLSESRGGSKSMQSIFRPRALRYSDALISTGAV